MLIKFRGSLQTDACVIIHEFVGGCDSDGGWERGVLRSFALVDVDGVTDEIIGLFEYCQDSDDLRGLDSDAYTAVDFEYFLGVSDTVLPDKHLDGKRFGVIGSLRYGQAVSCLVSVIEHPEPLTSFDDVRSVLVDAGFLV